MSRTHPVAALLTDFGRSDHYVGVMKGVMLSIVPQLQIIDITHDVEAQDVARAAYLLWASYRYFPKHTVFTCVVDPGVGTSRDIIVARSKLHTFVGPHNGILDYVLWSERIDEVEVIQMEGPKARAFFPAQISHTFHGRDLFAPLSAHLAEGIALGDVGVRRTVDWIEPPFIDEAHPYVKGRILDIDRFGNVVTNLLCPRFERPAGVKGIKLGTTRISRWIENYESAPSGVACLIPGSSGLVEIVLKRQSAAAALKAKTNVAVEILRP
jgi:S-adenosyl-L-methionine hydrolase (adenosine-forming)